MSDRISALRTERNHHLSSTFSHFWETEIIPHREELDDLIDRDILSSLTNSTSTRIHKCLEDFPSALELLYIRDAVTDVWKDTILDEDDTLTPTGAELARLFKGCPHSLTNARGVTLLAPEERVFNAGINTIKSRILNYADRIFLWNQINDPAQVAQIIRNSTNMVLVPSTVQIEKFPQATTWASLDPIELNESQDQLVFSAKAKAFLAQSRAQSNRKCPAREAMVQSPFIDKHPIPVMQDLMYWLADRIERPINSDTLN